MESASWSWPALRSLCWIGVAVFSLQCTMEGAVLGLGMLGLSLLERFWKDGGFIRQWSASLGLVGCVILCVSAVGRSTYHASLRNPYLVYGNYEQKIGSGVLMIVAESLALTVSVMNDLRAFPAALSNFCLLIASPTVLAIVGGSVAMITEDAFAVAIALSVASSLLIAVVTANRGALLPRQERALIGMMIVAPFFVYIASRGTEGIFHYEETVDVAAICVVSAVGFKAGGGELGSFQGISLWNAAKVAVWALYIIRASTARVAFSFPLVVTVAVVQIVSPLLMTTDRLVPLRCLLLHLQVLHGERLTLIFELGTGGKPYWFFFLEAAASFVVMAACFLIVLRPRLAREHASKGCWKFWLYLTGCFLFLSSIRREKVIVAQALLLIVLEADMASGSYLDQFRIVHSSLAGVILCFYNVVTDVGDETDGRRIRLSMKLYMGKLALVLRGLTTPTPLLLLAVQAWLIFQPLPLYIVNGRPDLSGKKIAAPSKSFLLRLLGALCCLLLVFALLEFSDWRGLSKSSSVTRYLLIGIGLIALSIHPALLIASPLVLLIEASAKSPGLWAIFIPATYMWLRNRKRLAQYSLGALTVIAAGLSSFDSARRMQSFGLLPVLALVVQWSVAFYSLLTLTMPSLTQRVDGSHIRNISTGMYISVGFIGAEILSLPLHSSARPMPLVLGDSHSKAFQAVGESLCVFGATNAIIAMAAGYSACTQKETDKPQRSRILPFAALIAYCSVVGSAYFLSSSMEATILLWSPLLLYNPVPKWYTRVLPARHVGRGRLVPPLMAILMGLFACSAQSISSLASVSLLTGGSTLSVLMQILTNLTLTLWATSGVLYFLGQFLVRANRVTRIRVSTVLALSSLVPLLFASNAAIASLSAVGAVLCGLAAASDSNALFSARFVV